MSFCGLAVQRYSNILHITISFCYSHVFCPTSSEEDNELKNTELATDLFRTCITPGNYALLIACLFLHTAILGYIKSEHPSSGVIIDLRCVPGSRCGICFDQTFPCGQTQQHRVCATKAYTLTRMISSSEIDFPHSHLPFCPAWPMLHQQKQFSIHLRIHRPYADPTHLHISCPAVCHEDCVPPRPSPANTCMVTFVLYHGHSENRLADST